ncbi:hypothetical protein D7D52_37320 [Nocardia yunnanensis]|uniref:Uncharacterized protein n=1 Tax=Nocardia yunnanensis TaxID=2382165 RepID=A0A386ZLV4_9NOCA|nr:hypothetical protein D7D52_37320 [Nocardia yunnanensis]
MPISPAPAAIFKSIAWAWIANEASFVLTFAFQLVVVFFVGAVAFLLRRSRRRKAKTAILFRALSATLGECPGWLH